jgi:type II secretory pathway pseudopilin PulG
MYKKTSGFTLIELLLVIAVIIILFGVVIFSLRPARIFYDTKEAKGVTDLESIDSGIQSYMINNDGDYPASIAALSPNVQYDVCRYGQSGCTASSVNLDVLVSSGILSAIPVATDCTLTTSTCYTLTKDSDDNITIEENTSAQGSGSQSPTGDTFAYAYTETIAANTNSAYKLMTMDTDFSGNLYYGSVLTGSNVDVNPTSGVDLKSTAGAEDFVLTKINANRTYAWSYVIGSAGIEAIKDIVVDSTGNVYVTGYYNGTNVDFNPLAGTDLKTTIGDTDLFLTKINADGTYGWTYAWGSNGPDISNAIAIDGSNNIYITGGFNGTNIDMNPTGGTDLKTSNLSMDIFASKFNANGTYGWTITMGDGSSFGNGDQAYGIAADNSGNIYITGSLIGTADMNPFGGVDTKTKSSTLYDLFLTKINSNFTYGWTYTYGTSGMSQFTGMPAVDSSGNLYVAGKFNFNFDFNPLSGTDTKTTQGGWDVFLTKLNSNGTYGWTQTMGGTGGDGGMDLEIDSSGNIYLSSFFGSASVDFDPTSGIDTKTTNGSNDTAITRINANGTYGWTHAIGGTLEDVLLAITTDPSRNIYFGGYFNSTGVDFDQIAGTDIKNASGANYDYAITKYIRN